jgi:hypothetical protein
VTQTSCSIWGISAAEIDYPVKRCPCAGAFFGFKKLGSYFSSFDFFIEEIIGYTIMLFSKYYE